MVIWLIGMSGSGKTTLGRELYDHYKKSNQNMVFMYEVNIGRFNTKVTQTTRNITILKKSLETFSK